MITPGQARDIYYATRRGDPAWQLVEKPLIQEELDLRAWKAVIDAVRAEVEMEMAAKLVEQIEKDAAG